MSIDLDAYFERIAHSGARAPTLENLRELHLRHPMAIPFENLSTLLRRAVPLELAELQHKLIASRRGGYCFEQNRLFATVLEEIGFRVTALAARVVWNQDRGWINPRTHMVLQIDMDDQYDWIADVGFGGLTLTAPLRLLPGVEQETDHEMFRFMEDDAEFVLQVMLDGDWRSMYRFDLQPQLPIDFEVLNHYVSTHPQSHFLTTLMAARPTATGRYSLSNNRLTTYSDGARESERDITSIDEIKSVLTDVFGIQLPYGLELDSALARIVERQE